MKSFGFLLLLITIVSAQMKFAPIVQIDGLGISTLQKNISKPLLLLGYAEMGCEVNNGPFTFTTILNVTDKMQLTVKNIKVQYKNIDEFNLYLGHTEVPFGSHYSNSVSYSFLRGLTLNQDIVLGITGTFADKHLTYNIAAVSSDSTTLNTGSAKINFISKFIISDVSVKTTLDSTDVAFGLSVRPNDKWDLTMRGYTELNGDVNACFSEITYYVSDKIAQSVRVDVLENGISGKSNTSETTLLFLNENVTLGAEYAILHDIQNNEVINPVNQVSLLASFIW